MNLSLQTLVVSPFQQNCRIVVDRDSGEAVKSITPAARSAGFMRIVTIEIPISMPGRIAAGSRVVASAEQNPQIASHQLALVGFFDALTWMTQAIAHRSRTAAGAWALRTTA